MFLILIIASQLMSGSPQAPERYLLARHGDFNRSDGNMLPKGQEEARALGQYIAANVTNISRIYCSPMKRALQTLVEVLSVLDEKSVFVPPIIILSDLHELDLKSEKEWSKWWKRPFQSRGFIDLQRRARSSWSSIRTAPFLRDEEQPHTTLILGHSALFRFMILTALDCRFTSFRDQIFNTANCGIDEIRWHINSTRALTYRHIYPRRWPYFKRSHLKEQHCE